MRSIWEKSCERAPGVQSSRARMVRRIGGYYRCAHHDGVLHLCHMSDTLTVRLPDELKKQLRAAARRRGMPVNRLIREQIERLVRSSDSQPWMKYAGTLSGPRDLSSRKGYSRR